MSIDLGNSPTPPAANPNTTEAEQIRNALNCFSRGGDTLDADAIITFANGSRLKEGTTDQGTGGNGGIAQVCSIDYELKWEAGSQYVMEQDGTTIRVEQFARDFIPTVADDETKGYTVGSRRILDNGVVYTCTDASEANATWVSDQPVYWGQSFAPTISAVLLTGGFDGSNDMPDILLGYAGMFANSFAYSSTGLPIQGAGANELYRDGAGTVYLVINGITFIAYSEDEINVTPETYSLLTWTGDGGTIAPTLIFRPVAAQPNSAGEILVWQSAPNGHVYYMSVSTDGTSPSGYWISFPAFSGNYGSPTYLNLANATNLSLNSGTSGFLPYDKGGTNAVSQQAAVNNVGGWIIDSTTSRNFANTDKNAIISCNSTGTITLTLTTGLDSKFTCQVLRYGTGDVIIAGVGVTILSQTSHKKITSQYDMITITRVATNTYVLSGNLKA
jgi:hypothetical protein